MKSLSEIGMKNHLRTECRWFHKRSISSFHHRECVCSY